MTDAVPNGKNRKRLFFTKKNAFDMPKEQHGPRKTAEPVDVSPVPPLTGPSHLTDCPEICSVLDQRSAGDMFLHACALRPGEW